MQTSRKTIQRNGADQMMNNFHLFRAIRFRWSQGYLNQEQRAPHWAVSNIFLGPQCPDLCNGRGKCLATGLCLCDQNYQGDSCQEVNLSSPNLIDFQESFTADDNLSRWRRISGGQRVIESSSGIGGKLVMNRHSVRLLETLDLDLTNAE